MCERVLFTMMMVHLTKLTMVPLFAYAATEGVRSGDRAGRDVSLRAGSGARRLDDDGSVCRNDIPGVGSSGGTGDICCVQECQQCGGDGCNAYSTDEYECCGGAIEDSGVSCYETPEAPCYFPKGGEETGDDAGAGADAADDDDEHYWSDYFSYKGCFEFIRPDDDATDDTNGIFTLLDYTNTFMSERHCFNLCAGLDGKYFGLFDGHYCLCGDEDWYLDTEKTDGNCDLECNGDDDQICGGAAAISLYKVDKHDPKCPGTDVVGVESEDGDVCCSLRCGVCDGLRCVGQGSCCEEHIKDTEETCDEEPYVPCVINY